LLLSTCRAVDAVSHEETFANLEVALLLRYSDGDDDDDCDL